MCFPVVKDIIPEGESGEFTVQHYSISGCKLAHKGRTLMTDSERERESNKEVVGEARGDVLIAGLGLGMILCAILSKPEVNKVSVVEVSKDVCNLVLPHLYKHLGKLANKLSVIEEDIYQFIPKGQYDVIYLDVWGDYSFNTYKQAEFLRSRFAPYLKDGGWMGSWMYEHMKELHNIVENIKLRR